MTSEEIMWAIRKELCAVGVWCEASVADGDKSTFEIKMPYDETKATVTVEVHQ